MVLLAAGVVLGGCLHAPPDGITKGIIEIRNLQLWDDDELKNNSGELTGLAIGQRTVLTSGHAFMFEPESGHPVQINREDVGYEILVDGLTGMRNDRAVGDKVFTSEQFQRDYLILRTDIEFDDYASVEPMRFDRVDDLRRATLVTRVKADGSVVTIPLRKLVVTPTGDLIFAKFSRERADRYSLSGSPIFGTYPDGSLILVGIVSGLGETTTKILGLPLSQSELMIVLPAWNIPFDVVTHD
ncbi:MAG: hypothetical protein JJ974_12530 [Phycisphaerales bacterium]|nr:hypothetical protein [Phycisphaerales bacterium]